MVTHRSLTDDSEVNHQRVGFIALRVERVEAPRGSVEDRSGSAETTVRVTLHTDYAPRVLIQVGLNDGKLTTINDIAQTFGISKTHLMKVVNDLGQKGYLDTVRGRNGGIRLLREPQDINIGQVVRDTENQLDVIGCLEHNGYCPIERVCVLRGALLNATEAFLAVLDAHTLADLTKPQRVLSSLLLE
jgi:Rrf2 family transcriptional regulator, nitric oxide-sensitive transcriptional repressor